MVRKRASARSPGPGRQGAASAVPAVPKAPAQSWKAFFSYVHDNDEDPAQHGPVPHHPESPARLETALGKLRGDRETWRSLRRLPPRKATDEEILLCHDEAHLAGLVKLAERAKEDGKPHFLPSCGPICIRGPCIQTDVEVREASSASDTYVTRGSIEVARASIGGLLGLIDLIFSEDDEEDHEAEATGDEHKLHQGLAFCRPPGHHASRNRSSGFCLFNNVAIAASYALKEHSSKVSKVMILDWDVHHGQGTQQIFEWSSDVLMINIHRHDGQDFYPGTGYANEVGLGGGKGYTINVPLPAGYGGAALWSACSTIVAPAARAFQPDLILVSSGFDAAAGDLLGGCAVAPAAFGLLTSELKKLARELCGGRLVLVLEGGYSLEVLADCVVEVSRSLVRDQPEEEGSLAFEGPMPSAIETGGGGSCLGAIRKVCEVHRNLALKLPVPPTAAERRRRTASRSCERPRGKTDGSEEKEEVNGSQVDPPPTSNEAKIEGDEAPLPTPPPETAQKPKAKAKAKAASPAPQVAAEPGHTKAKAGPSKGGSQDKAPAAAASKPRRESSPGAARPKEAPPATAPKAKGAPKAASSPPAKEPNAAAPPQPQPKEQQQGASKAAERSKSKAAATTAAASPQSDKSPKAPTASAQTSDVPTTAAKAPFAAKPESRQTWPEATLDLSSARPALVVRIALLEVPRDLAISSTEIWLWPSSTDVEAHGKDLLKWRFPRDFSARVDEEDERRAAKFRKGRGQLKLLLRAEKYPKETRSQTDQKDSGSSGRLSLVPIEH